MFNEKEIVLMHKSVPVASFSIDADEGYIISEIDVINHRHLPIPVQCALRTDTAARAMRKWVANRSIPDTRNAINDYLRELGVTTPSAAAYKSLGLNLSDQYWYKPTDVRIDWHDVNLFENNFPQKKFQSNAVLSRRIAIPTANYLNFGGSKMENGCFISRVLNPLRNSPIMRYSPVGYLKD